jgi:thioredoxin reductase
VRGERLDGVYTSLPPELPAALHGRDVVVAGGSFDAALQLARCCSSVTFVTTRTSAIAAARRGTVTILYGSEIICADGIERLESVVVRKIRTGAVSACNAAALFLLADAQNVLESKGS